MMAFFWQSARCCCDKDMIDCKCKHPYTRISSLFLDRWNDHHEVLVACAASRTDAHALAVWGRMDMIQQTAQQGTG